MMRWWREWRNPALRCERIGHRYGIQRRIGYILPREVDGERGLRARLDGAVAMDLSVTLTICKRCNAEDRERRVIDVGDAIHSLSMASADWRELRENGYFLGRDLSR